MNRNKLHDNLTGNVDIVIIIGMLSFLGYSYLNTQIDKTVHKMESASADFIDILQEPTR